MDNVPNPLSQMLGELDSLDRVERAQYLLELSDEFAEVPEEVATRPFQKIDGFPNANRKRLSGRRIKTTAR